MCIHINCALGYIFQSNHFLTGCYDKSISTFQNRAAPFISEWLARWWHRYKKNLQIFSSSSPKHVVPVMCQYLFWMNCGPSVLELELQNQLSPLDISDQCKQGKRGKPCWPRWIQFLLDVIHVKLSVYFISLPQAVLDTSKSEDFSVSVCLCVWWSH